jgi:uncharacterized protein (TIGR02453 family)
MLSKDALQFIDDLTENNNRDWFLENKKRYEKFKTQYQSLVADFLAEMKPLDSSLELLEVKNCTFRINRDIRFSKDKTPYKNHLGVWMSSGVKGANRAGYYIHIGKNESFLAAGCYSPEAEELKKIRKEIAFFYEDLEEIVTKKSFQQVFSGLDQTNSLKNAPKNYEKDHAAIEFLKLKSFVATQKFDYKDATKSNFVKDTVAKLILLKPLNDFINRALTTEE